MSADALALMQLLVLEDGRRWGAAADELQRADAEVVLSLDGPRRHWLGRARGYSKTSDVGGMTASVMLTQAPPKAKLYAAAADRDQARLLLDALEGFVHRTPEIQGVITVEAFKAHTARVTLEVLPADAASAFGLRPWWLVVDELCQWADAPQPRRFLDALTTSLPKRRDSRAVVITTAGDPSHFSRRVYETALAEPDLWRVSESHEVPPWIDPALIEAERRRLPESAFRRFWGNEWCQSEDAALPAEDVAACVAHAGPLEPRRGTSYVVTVDLGWRHARAAIAVAHREGDRIVVDRIEAYTGSRDNEVDLDAVEERVYDLACSYNHAKVFYDPREAIGAIQRLRRRGLSVQEHVFSVSSNTRLALRLLEFVKSRRLAIPDDAELVEELCSIRIVENGPGIFKVAVGQAADARNDRAVVVGMAAVHLEAAPSTPATSSVAAMARASSGTRHPSASSSLAAYGTSLDPRADERFEREIYESMRRT